ncbi:hypothetical protein [Pararhodobacter sp. CCB-MM2]|nr:hypothetical protein [Pararhodobacter sp. CCB-MM2]MCA2011837.1 hypothetical protein [Cereibacter sphaeroides]
MNTQTKTSMSIAATQPRGGSLPAGAGIVLAMMLGGAFWLGIYALVS